MTDIDSNICLHVSTPMDASWAYDITDSAACDRLLNVNLGLVAHRFCREVEVWRRFHQNTIGFALVCPSPSGTLKAREAASNSGARST